ncbi:hypothetical protein M8C21_001549 [Ambrosia artemisiifolia]|uniref:MLO-like protein n=1 Tax=Ambrosia artemisiifolia TaxID=4212 RepID=A0AAD5GEY6_AMBAR|nr:hypothetical protein M8C21_001549 [Ambrosia artemisiifolia]
METKVGKSLVETPTWAVASVVSVMVLLGFFINASLGHTEKWLYRTKRKALIAALDKIKEELMLFAVLSLLMGHWIVYAAKICVKSSAINSQFYPCSVEKSSTETLNHQLSFNNFSNYAVSRQLLSHKHSQICPEGSSSFVSKESLEQLHRFLLVLGVTHVSYSFFAIALAMIKLENLGKPSQVPGSPWTTRQIWSSINRADYKALRLGFITTHNLPLSYDFHNYMLRSMEEEFRDIVGISIPLWIFAISCIFLGFHGTNIYFWLSFLPAIMGSRFKKTIVSENVRESLHTWRRRVKAKHKHDPPFTLLPTTSSNMSLDSMVDDDHDVPIACVHNFLDKSESSADLEVSTHDENVDLDPATRENDDCDDCDEIYSSSESQRFEL